MNMDQAAVWLAGSILTMLGFIIIVAGVVVINNIIHRYWKPMNWFTPDSWRGFHPPTAPYVEQEEPSLVKENVKK
jgi:hypothetical protein